MRGRPTALKIRHSSVRHTGISELSPQWLRSNRVQQPTHLLSSKKEKLSTTRGDATCFSWAAALVANPKDHVVLLCSSDGGRPGASLIEAPSQSHRGATLEGAANTPVCRLGMLLLLRRCCCCDGPPAAAFVPSRPAQVGPNGRRPNIPGNSTSTTTTISALRFTIHRRWIRPCFAANTTTTCRQQKQQPLKYLH